MRKAFTLVELLVVIAIIGGLVALLLPAIQAAREAARRTQCRNNLKNIGLSLLNYETAFNYFPTGGTTFGDRLECYCQNGKPWQAPKQGMSWAFQILPYLEQGALANIGSSDIVQNTPVALYNCPSRRGPTQYIGGYGPAYLMDYAGATPGTAVSGVAGAARADAQRDHNVHDRVKATFWMLNAGGFSGGQPPNNGVYDGVIVRSPWRRTGAPTTCGPNPAVGEFAQNVPYPTKMAQISDGTTATLMVAEKYINSNDQYGYAGGDASDDRGWMDGWDPDTMRSTMARPYPDDQISPIRDGTPAGEDQTYLFGSAHSSAFNGVFADGSVRTISYDVEMYVFNSLGTKNGEAVGETTDMPGVN
jgi:prepilin-type N-terminal cleavage/methylation domain-containing protein/prepilin-type processing-associated H-X9-DG protein